MAEIFCQQNLDDIVIHEVTRRILHLDRLKVLLEEYLVTVQKRDFHHGDELRELRHGHSDEEAGLARLIQLVEQDLVNITDPVFRERMVSLRFRRGELATEVAKLVRTLSNCDPIITPEKVERLAGTLSKQFHQTGSDLQQAYARLILDEFIVKGDEITISGSKSIFARSAVEPTNEDSPAVLSFVRQWRAWQDSNLQLQA